MGKSQVSTELQRKQQLKPFRFENYVRFHPDIKKTERNIKLKTSSNTPTTQRFLPETFYGVDDRNNFSDSKVVNEQK